jgi:hypothetical protein
MSQLCRTVPKERIEQWNKILALKTALEDHGHDLVIDEFDIDLFKGEQHVVTFKLVNGDKESGPYLDVVLWDDGTEVYVCQSGHERLDDTFFMRDSYMGKEWNLKIQAALTTEGGVEIPVDNQGNPLSDAPGKYDRAARSAGAATKHMPSTKKTSIFALSTKPCSIPGHVILTVYKMPRTDKPNDEYVQQQMPKDFADYIVKLHEQNTSCQRCESLIKNGYCQDETCPFSDHEQHCPIGWMGHDAHREVDEDTECDCVRKKGK